MYVLQSYQNYHKTINKDDKATFSISKLNLETVNLKISSPILTV